ncbi:MAG: hypothetical protein MJ252_23380, partial [archaeon]|nr:hypothetical protein [archaeon]
EDNKNNINNLDVNTGLEGLIGLENVKAEIKKLIALLNFYSKLFSFLLSSAFTFISLELIILIKIIFYLNYYLIEEKNFCYKPY